MSHVSASPKPPSASPPGRPDTPSAPDHIPCPPSRHPHSPSRRPPPTNHSHRSPTLHLPARVEGTKPPPQPRLQRPIPPSRPRTQMITTAARPPNRHPGRPGWWERVDAPHSQPGRSAPATSTSPTLPSVHQPRIHHNGATNAGVPSARGARQPHADWQDNRGEGLLPTAPRASWDGMGACPA